MENTYFISDYSDLLDETIDVLQLTEFVIAHERFDNDSSYHNYTTGFFKENKIDKLIIPISLSSDMGNYEGLKIALHLRLNYELTIEERLTPIVFLSDFDLKNTLSSTDFDIDSNPQYLLFTKGCSFSTFDTDEIKEKLKRVEKILACEYKNEVLNKLKISPKANVGKHSIANAWGCYKLALVSGNKTVLESSDLAENLKSLYAKYLICQNDSYSESRFCELNADALRLQDKNILFIDDQGDEGWNDLMRKIFLTNLTIVDSAKYKNKDTKSFHDFDGFYEECRSHIGEKWDLIITDLRLNPEKEDIDNDLSSPNELSGYKLMDEFLLFNEGTQIILFTASNKIWNINSALRRGASSYYIKESPEFNYSVLETKNQYDNFKSDVKKCFNRNYLFDIFEVHKKCKSRAISDYQETQLNIAFQLLKDSSNPKHLDFAFLSYYQIIEDYADANVELENGAWFVGNECVIDSQNNWELKFISKSSHENLRYANGYPSFDYFKKENVPSDHPLTAIANVSFVLAYKYGMEDSSLKEWGRLNFLRNEVAVHKKKKEKTNKDIPEYISIDNIKSILKIVELFLTNDMNEI